jgi:glutamine cyclotransferase
MSLQYLTNANPPPAESVLQYDVEPNIVLVSTSAQQFYANLTITVYNPTSAPVNCMEFQFGFLAGATTGNLTTAAEARTIAPVSDQNEWGIVNSGSINTSDPNLYLFTATPSGIDKYLPLAPAASLVFYLNDILIDQSVGEGIAPFTIIEETGTSKPTKQTVQGTLDLTKAAGTLSITAFNVEPPAPVAPGASIELSWTLNDSDHWQLYDSDAATLLYDSNTSTPPNLTEWPVPPQTLEPEQTTSYRLIAWAGQIYTAANATAMVASPQVTATGPTAPVNALSDVIISWTSANAQTVEIYPTGQTASATSGQGTFTVQPIESTVYMLIATDANNDQSQPAYVQVQVNAPQIISFMASPTTCQPEASVNLSWETQSASLASLSQSILGSDTNDLGSVNVNSIGYAVTPTGISIYTLTANQGPAASQTAAAVEELTVEVANSFQALTYDNQNNLLWVLDGSSLYGLNPGNGSMSRQPMSLKGQANGIIFDGTYLWVSNGSNFVTQMTASTGKVQNDIQVGTTPTALVHDSVNNLIWVTNFGDGTVSRIDATDGTIVGDVVEVATSGSFTDFLNSLVFDGSNVWGNNSVGSPLYRIPASKAQQITATPIEDIYANGLTFDGSNVWAVCSDGTAKKFDGEGTVLASYGVGQNPLAILSDGTHLWTVSDKDRNVTMWQAVDGTALGIFPVAIFPYRLAFDGRCIWVRGINGKNGARVLIKL